MPILLGVCLVDSPEAVYEVNSYFKTIGKVGCRDVWTYNLLKSKGIAAFVSGCYSITLPKRKITPRKKKVFFVGVCEEFKKYIPKDILEHAEFIIQRRPFSHHPLTLEDMNYLDDEAKKLIERYKNEATLIVSPLLHCISPCIGMGIPVILAREEYNHRFSAIKNITTLYLKDDWGNINWQPGVIDVEHLKNKMLVLAKDYILNNEINIECVEFIHKQYGVQND